LIGGIPGGGDDDACGGGGLRLVAAGRTQTLRQMARDRKRFWLPRQPPNVNVSHWPDDRL